MEKQKIVLAVDSFKGCMSSVMVEGAIAAALRHTCPQVEVTCVPVADGGEGLLEVLVKSTRGKKVALRVHDALMRPVTAYYGVLGDGVTAVVELAEASGLARLLPEERNPMVATTYGTGELIRAVLDAGFRRVIVGLGGSATNDAGMGLMQALGARFYNARHEALAPGSGGGSLSQVAEMELADFYETVAGVEWLAACDVDSPFAGKRGAACVFAPQKGAACEEVEALDWGLRHFAACTERATGFAVMDVPGAGAAGGVGGCLSAYFQAKLLPGIDLVFEQIGFENCLQGASLVVTGEGSADAQTLMGKVPAGVLKLGRRSGIPVALLAGRVRDEELLRRAGFARIVQVTPAGQPLSEAMRPEVAIRNVMAAAPNLLQKETD